MNTPAEPIRAARRPVPTQPRRARPRDLARRVAAAAVIACGASLARPAPAGAQPSADAEQRAVEGLLDEARAERVKGSDDAAAEKYDQASERAAGAANNSAALRALVANERAVALLGSDPAAAAAAFEGVDFDAVAEAGERAVYHYNYGRALEEAGKHDPAVEQFRLALRAAPTFSQASEALMRRLLATEGRETAAPECLGVIVAALDAGDLPVAAHYLKPALRKWGESTVTPKLLDQLARYYRLSGLTPERFAKGDPDRPAKSAASKGGSERESLAKLGSHGEMVRRGAEVLDRAFTLDKPASCGDRDLEPFKSWPGSRGELAALLMAVADLKARDGNLEGALLRYSAAWQLDNGIRDAAVACAALLRDPDRKLDPDGARRRTLVNGIFDVKGGMYSRGARTDPEKDALRRLHVVLGTIFTEEEAEGHRVKPESEYETAKFQWKQAAFWQERLEDKQAFPPIAEIHARYAAVLEKQRDQVEAAKQYLSATKLFVARKDGEGARDAIAACKRLGIPLSASQEKEITRLDEVAQRLLTTSPRSRNSPAPRDDRRDPTERGGLANDKESSEPGRPKREAVPRPGRPPGGAAQGPD
jgi:tetratricopeptide (TPR) repeat protein